MDRGAKFDSFKFLESSPGHLDIVMSHITRTMKIVDQKIVPGRSTGSCKLSDCTTTN